MGGSDPGGRWRDLHHDRRVRGADASVAEGAPAVRKAGARRARTDRPGLGVPALPRGPGRGGPARRPSAPSRHAARDHRRGAAARRARRGTGGRGLVGRRRSGRRRAARSCRLPPGPTTRGGPPDVRDRASFHPGAHRALDQPPCRPVGHRALLPGRVRVGCARGGLASRESPGRRSWSSTARSARTATVRWSSAGRWLPSARARSRRATCGAASSRRTRRPTSVSG